MNTFKKIKLKNSEYDYLFIAIESDTTVVEAVPVIKKINKNAKILFDMFLKQGNNSRRFIEYNYVNNEEIDINKFNIVHNVSDDIYNTTKSFFKKNILLLELFIILFPYTPSSKLNKSDISCVIATALPPYFLIVLNILYIKLATYLLEVTPN